MFLQPSSSASVAVAQTPSLHKEPPWFQVVRSGKPSWEKASKEMTKAGVVALLFAAFAFIVPTQIKPFWGLASLAFWMLLCVALRKRFWYKQRVRIVGSVLEYDNGTQITQISLSRASLHLAATPPGFLVLLLQDGNAQLALGRQADIPDLLNLPIYLGHHLELTPEDFEEIRLSAQRSYPQA